MIYIKLCDCMGRKKGPDMKKVAAILETLKKNPEGMWIMELSRATGISKSTVHRYIHNELKNVIEESMSFSGLVKVYKLKDEYLKGEIDQN